MANSVPPIPYKTKVLQESGYLTEPWKKFFREIYSRLGGTNELPATGADVATNASDIVNLKLRLDALEQEPVA